MHTLAIMFNDSFKEKWLELHFTDYKKIMNACIVLCIVKECAKMGVVPEDENIMF